MREKNIIRGIALFSAMAGGMMSACSSDSAGQPASAALPPPPSTTSTTVAPPSTSTSPSSPAPQFTSCISNDPNHICIGLKIVSYKDSSGNPTLLQSQADTLVQGINSLWKTCNVGFQIEEFDAVDPATYGLQFGANSENELTQIRQTFSNSQTFLIVATGPWNTSSIAWTEMPGGGPYGTVVDSDYAMHPVAVGHELGHYQSLDHDPNIGNLMYYIVYDTDTAITQTQCDRARQADISDWQPMLRK